MEGVRLGEAGCGGEGDGCCTVRFEVVESVEDDDDGVGVDGRDETTVSEMAGSGRCPNANNLFKMMVGDCS